MGTVTFGVPQEIVLDLARLNQSTTFVETGTYKGGTTRWAAEHFKTVHTIERSEGLYERHGPELARIEGVTPHLGDSRDVLPRLVSGLGDETAVFWLDGHWSGGETAGEKDECPILDELSCLSSRSDDIVLIDDAWLFLCAPPAPHDPAQWPTITDIVAALPASDRAPFVQIVDDVIFVIPGRDVLKDRLVAYARERADASSEQRKKKSPIKRILKGVRGR